MISSGTCEFKFPILFLLSTREALDLTLSGEVHNEKQAITELYLVEHKLSNRKLCKALLTIYFFKKFLRLPIELIILITRMKECLKNANCQ